MNASKQDGTTGRPYGGQTKEQRSLKRREQFIQAGFDIYGTTGYKSATVKQICSAAGLTDRYFYEEFGNSEKLLLAVYERGHVKLLEAVVSAIEPHVDDPIAAIKAGLRALFETTREPKLARVCWIEVLGISPEVDAAYIDGNRQFVDLLITYTRNHFPQIEIDEDEERVLGIAAVGAANQTVMYWLLGGYKEDIETVVAVNQRLFEGLLAGLKS